MILNHTVEALMERRSIRSYRSEQISEEELTDVLKAGKYAPSAMGRQARHFTVIQNKGLLSDVYKRQSEWFYAGRRGELYCVSRL